jgi:hypothetical protein
MFIFGIVSGSRVDCELLRIIVSVLVFARGANRDGIDVPSLNPCLCAQKLCTKSIFLKTNSRLDMVVADMIV